MPSNAIEKSCSPSFMSPGFTLPDRFPTYTVSHSFHARVNRKETRKYAIRSQVHPVVRVKETSFSVYFARRGFLFPILTAMLSTAEIRNCLYNLVLATWRITPPQTGPSSSPLINATMNPFIDTVHQAHSQRQRRNPHENEK